MKTRRFKFNKPVRDKMPEILRAQGIRVTEHSMKETDYRGALKDKLLEEAHEVIKTQTIEETLEELSKLLEVMQAFATQFGLSMSEIEKKRLHKKEIKGGFEQATYIDSVEVATSSKSIHYFLNDPEKYSEIEEIISESLVMKFLKRDL